MTVVFEGTPKKVQGKYHHLVKIEGREVYLPYHLFRLLLTMTLKRGDDRDFIHSDTLLPCSKDKTASYYIYRLRKHLEESGLDKDIVRSNEHGGYRFDVPLKNIYFSDELFDIVDEETQMFLAEIKR